MLERDVEVLDPIQEQDETYDDVKTSSTHSYRVEEELPRPKDYSEMHWHNRVNAVHHGKDSIKKEIRSLKESLRMSDAEIEERVRAVHKKLTEEDAFVYGDRAHAVKSLNEMEDIVSLLTYERDACKINIEQLDGDIDAIDVELVNYRKLKTSAEELWRRSQTRYQNAMMLWMLALDKAKKEHDRIIANEQALVHPPEAKLVRNNIDSAYDVLARDYKNLEDPRKDMERRREVVLKHEKHRKDFALLLGRAREMEVRYEELLAIAWDNCDMLEEDLEDMKHQSQDAGGREEDIYEDYQEDY